MTGTDTGHLIPEGYFTGSLGTSLAFSLLYSKNFTRNKLLEYNIPWLKGLLKKKALFIDYLSLHESLYFNHY